MQISPLLEQTPQNAYSSEQKDDNKSSKCYYNLQMMFEHVTNYRNINDHLKDTRNTSVLVLMTLLLNYRSRTLYWVT